MLPKLKLTDRFIQNVVPDPVRQIEYVDEKTPGLRLRVSPGGTKAFYVWYRISRHPRRVRLGVYRTMSLSEARSEARMMMLKVGLGEDPVLSRRTTAALKRTFEAIVTEYVDRHAKPRNRSWPETERLLLREFVPHWRGRLISEISKPDVHDVLDAIGRRGTPSAANHAFAAVRALMNWAVARGILERSPCQGMKAPAPIVKGDRVLTHPELGMVWHASELIGYPFGCVVQLLIATGQRRNEVAGLRWDELDLDRATWLLSGQRNKSGRLHRIPLNRIAIRILQGIPRRHSTLVFPARNNRNPISGFSKWKVRIDSLSDVKGWRLHDLRRTFRTEIERLRVPWVVGERILNHNNLAQGSLAATYNQYDYWEEASLAMDRWAVELERIVSKYNSDA